MEHNSHKHLTDKEMSEIVNSLIEKVTDVIYNNLDNVDCNIQRLQITGYVGHLLARGAKETVLSLMVEHLVTKGESN